MEQQQKTSMGNSELILIRLNADGSLDNNFATAGKFSFSLGTAIYSVRTMTQPDGKILVYGGIEDITSPNTTLFSMRLLSNGLIDHDYGNNGKMIYIFPNGDFYPKSVSVQADGKILVAGYCNSSSSIGAVVRINETVSTNISDLAALNCRIYPNPATNLLQIAIKEKTGEASFPIAITNALGEVVIKDVIDGERKAIDVSCLPNGMYFINNRRFIKR